MSETLITQTPDPSVIIGAYYELFLRSDQDEPKDYIRFANTCTFHASLQPIAGPTVEDAQKFRRLTAEWRQQRGAMSWVTEMVMCPAYQGIIGMGPIAIPLILSQLEAEGDEPDHWFWALRALTGANPVTSDQRGDIVRMSQAWIDWGKSSGYAW